MENRKDLSLSRGETVKCQLLISFHATQPRLLNLNESSLIMGQQLKLT